MQKKRRYRYTKDRPPTLFYQEERREKRDGISKLLRTPKTPQEQITQDEIDAPTTRSRTQTQNKKKTPKGMLMK
jgi:hypothetical protein